MEEDSSYLRYNFQQKGSINMAMSKGRRRRRKSIRFGRVVGGIIALLAITLLGVLKEMIIYIFQLMSQKEILPIIIHIY